MTSARRTRAEPDLVLGRYRVDERLGAGAFGVVWRAWDVRLEREVALKEIPVEPGGTPFARVEREARAAARLAHPGIVALYELGRDEHAVFLVFELVRGHGLAELLGRGVVSDRDLARIGAVLCEALAHAHARGVIHRDVKPHNVIVAAEPAAGSGWAKLTDFGVAHLAAGESLTVTGEVLGTLAYMAPEQAEGRVATGAADVYGLALTLYEGWTGENPLRREGPLGWARRGSRPLPRLRTLRRDLPPALGRAIDAALDPRPERRPSPTELGAALVAAEPGLDDDGGLEEATTDADLRLAPRGSAGSGSGSTRVDDPWGPDREPTRADGPWAADEIPTSVDDGWGSDADSTAVDRSWNGHASAAEPPLADDEDATRVDGGRRGHDEDATRFDGLWDGAPGPRRDGGRRAWRARGPGQGGPRTARPPAPWDPRPRRREASPSPAAALRAMPRAGQSAPRAAPTIPLPAPAPSAPRPLGRARARRAGTRLVAATTGGAVVAAALAAFGVPEGPPLGAAAAVTLLVLPRVAWLAWTAGLLAWLALGPPGLPGGALALLPVVAAVPLLLPRAGWAWSVPALAPALGLLGPAPLYLGLAARAATVWRRAALGAIGAAALLVGEAGRRTTTYAADRAPQDWTASVPDALGDVLVPLVLGPAPPLALVWAALAVALPVLVRGAARPRVVGAVAWIVLAVLAHGAVAAFVGLEPSPEAVAGVLGGVVGAALLAVLVPRAASLPHDGRRGERV